MNQTADVIMIDLDEASFFEKGPEIFVAENSIEFAN